MAVELVCEQCGETYSTRPSQAGRRRFCSHACNNSWRSIHLVGEAGPGWKGGHIEKICEQCGEIYCVRPSGASQRFCSRKCFDTWKDYGRRVEIICKQCGYAFSVRPSAAKSRCYCSRACVHKWQSANLRGRASPSWNEGKELVCEWCGDAFSVKPSRANQSYCSTACASKANTGEQHHRWGGGPSDKICEQCGQAYTVGRAHAEVQRFCSGSCMGKAYSGSESPSWRGGLSFQPHGPEFNNALKQTIRERDNYVCQICGSPENGRAHACHHIDYDKQNSAIDNLILLCTTCHNKTNHNRAYWQAHFQS